MNKEGTPQSNPNYGESTLTPTQQATFDMGVYKFLKAYGGINRRWGWIPWNDPEFTIKVKDGNDMDTATPMELLELVKEFLPPVRDRGGKARREGAVLLENKMAQVQRSLTGLAATKPNSKISKKGATKKTQGAKGTPTLTDKAYGTAKDFGLVGSLNMLKDMGRDYVPE